MKLYTPDKTVLMDVSRVTALDGNLVIEGKIMGSMPMKAFLRPAELRAGLRLVKPGLILAALRMLFSKRA